jgi:Ca2+-binding EF-hand superfamily protein
MARADVDPEELREIFDHYDADHNGFIDAREFGSLCRALDGGFSSVEIETGWMSVDTNKNGRIEFEEFANWWADT